MWFVLAFVVIVILIAVSVLILNQGQGYALGGIEDMINSVSDMIG